METQVAKLSNQNLNFFNNKNKLVEGWYWLARSKEIKKKKAIGANLWGRELVLFRGEDGLVRAMDAYCPHMGAHLKEGSVQGNDIRCMFHFWKFSGEGKCVDIPCQKSISGIEPISNWPVCERYGLIWLWPGKKAKEEVPVVPELEGLELESTLGSQYEKKCHPNVMMINAIDEQHFRSVHNLVVDLYMRSNPLSRRCIQFTNTTPVPKNSLFTKLFSKLYEDALTYEMTYWYGNTGTVMVGPKFLHFYIMFASRPTPEGRTIGQTILITKKRSGIKGLLLNPIILFLTKLVGNYFAKGDTIIFESIKFDFRTPIRADHAIIDFVNHYENQAESEWSIAASKSLVETAKADSPQQVPPTVRPKQTHPSENIF